MSLYYKQHYQQCHNFNNNTLKTIHNNISTTIFFQLSTAQSTFQEWEIRKQEREQEEKIRLENWNQLTRAQKIVQYKLENESIASYESVELHEKCEQQKKKKLDQ